MPAQPSVLIFAQPASLRDSLQVLLSSSQRAKSILMASDVASIRAAEPGYNPALVLYAMHSGGSGGVQPLAQIRDAWTQVPILVMVNNEEEAQAAREAGAQRVLLQGILASNLIREVDEMLGEASLYLFS